MWPHLSAISVGKSGCHGNVHYRYRISHISAWSMGMGVRYKLFSRFFLSFISCWILMTFNRMERTNVFSHILLLSIVLLLLLFAVLFYSTETSNSTVRDTYYAI